MNILELFAHIGLKADTGPAEAFGKGINGIKGAIVGAVAGTLSLSAAIGAVNAQFAQSLSMKRFADDTGESVEEMQKWKAVAQQTSGAGESVAASIRAISSNQAKIRLGQGNISGYQLLGIDSRSDPFKVLEAIRTKTQGLSQSMRRNIASQFGISNDLVATLELTNEQFDEMASNAFVIPSENIDSMNKARASVETVKNAINFLTAKFVTALAPAIKMVSDKIAEFTRNNGASLARWIQQIIQTITRVLGLIDKTIKSTVGWKTVLMGLAAVFFILNSAIMLPVAAIALLFIALEDIAAYSRGEDSLVGRFLKGMPEFKKVFDGLLEIVQLLITAIGSVFSGDFTKLDEMTRKWGLFGDVLTVIAHALEIINRGLSMEDFNASMKGIKEKGFFQEYGEQWGNLWEQVKNTDWTGNKAAAAAEQSSGAVTSVTTSAVITVQGATDPTATGQAVSDYIRREQQKAFDMSAKRKAEK